MPINPKKSHRVTMVVKNDDYERIRYWADRNNMSVNEYALTASLEKMEHENGDYDLPTLEQARLAQLVSAMEAMSVRMNSLEHVVTSGFGSLLSLTRGDNYLLEDD